MQGIKLDILIEDQRWKKVPHLAVRLVQAADATFTLLPKALRQPLAMTVLLTNDQHVTRLNHDFRGFNKPTNVLSFPQFSKGKLTKKGKSAAPIHVGDIVLGYQYIVAEAKNNHKILINHAVHLLIHGILHILGYDHASNVEAIRMERLETRIMAELALPDPYERQPRELKVR